MSDRLQHRQTCGSVTHSLTQAQRFLDARLDFRADARHVLDLVNAGFEQGGLCACDVGILVENSCKTRSITFRRS